MTKLCIDCMNFVTKSMGEKDLSDSFPEIHQPIMKRLEKQEKAQVVWCKKKFGRVYIHTFQLKKIEAKDCDSFDDADEN